MFLALQQYKCLPWVREWSEDCWCFVYFAILFLKAQWSLFQKFYVFIRTIISGVVFLKLVTSKTFFMHLRADRMSQYQPISISTIVLFYFKIYNPKRLPKESTLGHGMASLVSRKHFIYRKYNNFPLKRSKACEIKLFSK